VNEIAKEIIAGKIQEGQKILIDFDDDKIKFII